MALRHYITSVNIKKLFYTCEDPAGDASFIFFSHSSWNN